MQSTHVVLFLIWLWYSLSVESRFEEIEFEKSFPYIHAIVKPDLPRPLNSSPRVRGSLSGRKNSRKKTMKTHTKEIQQLVDFSQDKTSTGGPLQALIRVLIIGQTRLNYFEALDIGDTWERYVFATGFARKTLSAPGQETFPSFGREDLSPTTLNMFVYELADHLKSRYICCSAQSDLWGEKDLSKETIEQMQQWKEKDLTPDVWNIAVRFYHLSTMWKRKMLIEGIVTQMAIFSHFEKVPKPSIETMNQQLHDGRTQSDREAIKKFYEWVQSPCHYDNPAELNNILNKIVPNPHNMGMMKFPNISSGIELCSQEYFAVTERRQSSAIQHFFSLN
ncbi:hypothetical protein PCASD_09202 [Puccinia coronata f. sp. avenae]|uniref:Uncharacterized protein n=1 Tax=Puccinia coronata f. sp. avenae TaxID=200324 RepID=A0A2N5TGA1_9BASI|nr:hypothetical protein PCASD_09202 [Puccinia coronata f. sp. avenae]